MALSRIGQIALPGDSLGLPKLFRFGQLVFNKRDDGLGIRF